MTRRRTRTRYGATRQGGWDGYTDELGDEPPTVTCRPGPLWHVVAHYLFLAALAAGIVAVVAR
jgi:hypothetical protein